MKKDFVLVGDLYRKKMGKTIKDVDKMYEEVEKSLIKVARDDSSSNQESAIMDISTQFFAENIDRLNANLKVLDKDLDAWNSYIFFFDKMKDLLKKYDPEEIVDGKKASLKTFFTRSHVVREVARETLADKFGISKNYVNMLYKFNAYAREYEDRLDRVVSVEEIIAYANEEEIKKANEKNALNGNNKARPINFDTPRFIRIVKEHWHKVETKGNIEELLSGDDDFTNIDFDNNEAVGYGDLDESDSDAEEKAVEGEDYNSLTKRDLDNYLDMRTFEEQDEDIKPSVKRQRVEAIDHNSRKVTLASLMCIGEYSDWEREFFIDLDNEIEDGYDTMLDVLHAYYEREKDRLPYSSYSSLEEEYCSIFRKILDNTNILKGKKVDEEPRFESVVNLPVSLGGITYDTEAILYQFKKLSKNYYKDTRLLLEEKSDKDIIDEYMESVTYEPLSYYLMKIIKRKFKELPQDVEKLPLSKFNLYKFIEEKNKNNCKRTSPIIRNTSKQKGPTNLSIFDNKKSAQEYGFFLDDNSGFENKDIFAIFDVLHSDLQSTNKRNRFRRAIFALSFALGFDADVVSYIFTKPCKELDFNPKSKEESFYYYCFNNEKVSYNDMCTMYVEFKNVGIFDAEKSSNTSVSQDTMLLRNELRSVRTKADLEKYLLNVEEANRQSIRKSFIELLRELELKRAALEANPDSPYEVLADYVYRDMTKEEKLQIHRSIKSGDVLEKDRVQRVLNYVYSGEVYGRTKVTDAGEDSGLKTLDFRLNVFDNLKYTRQDIMDYQTGEKVPPRALFLLFTAALISKQSNDALERYQGFDAMANKYLRKAGYQDLYIRNQVDFILALCAINDNPILALRAMLKHLEDRNQ